MFGRKVKEFLSRNNIVFTDRNIDEDEAALNELEKLGYMTTPVTVIDGEIVIGFDAHKLLLQINKAGLHEIACAINGR